MVLKIMSFEYTKGWKKDCGRQSSPFFSNDGMGFNEGCS